MKEERKNLREIRLECVKIAEKIYIIDQSIGVLEMAQTLFDWIANNSEDIESKSD